MTSGWPRAAGIGADDGNSLDIEARGDGSAIGKGLLTATAENGIFITEAYGDMMCAMCCRSKATSTLAAAVSILDAVDLMDPTNPRLCR